MVRQREPAKDSYHHGDLRSACVAEGLLLLVESGKDAVSLREIARRCGVSPRAPYRHFPDRLHLLAAIAEVGFAEFGRALGAAAGEGRHATLEAELTALAQAYVEFARDRPALMQLMFGSDFGDRKQRFPALHSAALSTFQFLEARVAKLTRGSNAALHAAIAWALVHGLAELYRNGQFALVLPEDPPSSSLTRAAVAVFARGARGAAAVDSEPDSGGGDPAPLRPSRRPKRD